MASTAFVRVDLDLIRSSTPLDFNLYMDTPGSGRVLAVPKGRVLEEEPKQRLSRRRTRVYILDQEREGYRGHLEEGLKELIRGERIDEGQAASLAYNLSLQAVETVFRNPDRETLDRADASFQATAELILSRERALFALLELTRNSRLLHVHSCNVAVFGLGLARGLMARGLEIDLRRLSPALFFHDLGAVSLDPELVGRAEDLGGEDLAKLREHPAIGRELLEQAGLLTPEAEAVVYGHHERLDGSGFPEGLRDDEIPLLAKVCAVADVYDDLTSDRPGRPGLEGLQAARLMVQEMTDRLDPSLLRSFIEMFSRASRNAG